MNKDNLIKSKSFAFALRIIKLYQYLTEEKKEYILRHIVGWAMPTLQSFLIFSIKIN